MQENPPWEWVDGDPLRVAQYTFGQGIFLGITLSLAAIWSVVLASVLLGHPLVTLGPAASMDVFWVSFAVIESVLVIQAFYLGYFARKFPIVGRLGISPLGVRLILPRREEWVGWPSLARVGIDSIEVRPYVLLQRFRLTPRQVARLDRFMRLA